jgi:hypothetical protein
VEVGFVLVVPVGVVVGTVVAIVELEDPGSWFDTSQTRYLQGQSHYLLTVVETVTEETVEPEPTYPCL